MIVEEAETTIDVVSGSLDTVNGSIHAESDNISASKIVDIDLDESSEDTTGYIFMDMEIISHSYRLFPCPDCSEIGGIHLIDSNEKKKGFARYLVIKCRYCPFVNEFYSSKQVVKKDTVNKGGSKYMDINLRAVYGFRAVGVGHTQIKKLCGYLNMPEPMSKESYQATSNFILAATKQIAENSMSEAAAEIRGANDTSDTSVSVDGSWQKKRFSSANGVVQSFLLIMGRFWMSR